MSPEVDIVEIGGGNIGSVTRCLERLGVSYEKVNSARKPDGSRPLILPGVGAFGAVMEHLEKDGLADSVRALVRGGTPYLGICIGMQILFDGSEESKGVRGLGLVPGNVVKYQKGKIPQIGWNRIEPSNKHGDWEAGYVYFVNSYYPAPTDKNIILHSADYFGPFCASLQTNNITAFQFHPEKSGDFGQALLRKWVKHVS
jgi:imidazole glycerol phosphate synthase glutamine amidotransferase subunit